MIEAAITKAVEDTVSRVLAGAEDRIVAKVISEMSRRWPEPDGWYTRAELAEQLEVAIDTVDRRIAARDPAIEVRRIRRAVRCRLRARASEAEIARLASEARR